MTKIRLKCNQISLNGTDLKNDTYNFALEGLFDHEKSHFDSELYSDGSFIPYTKINAKQMVLNGYIKSSNPSDHISINKILSNRNLQELIVDVEGFRKVMLNVKVTNRLTGDDYLGKISCQLIAADPYLYEAEKQVLSINEIKGTSVKFPLRFPIRFESGENFEKYVDNVGTEISYPVITIAGPCSDFIIKNETTNEKLDFAGLELLDGDSLVIDNRPKSRGIYLNGANRIDLKLGNWISCNIGQNYFTFSRVSNSSNNLCTIEFQSRWL
ncbi:phage distal tail protein [Romboutsia sp.]|uniref:phage distal tail protein n=1 Tax=Romboutsia sp. TaxID=1965302 RepID=UPI002D1BE3D0|nr:hypothetical protein [Romboutsia sp.]HSQ89107.1 hypothetical protein [Romboutsia sp.]